MNGSAFTRREWWNLVNSHRQRRWINYRFNTVSIGPILAAGLFGAVVGSGIAGPGGAIVGFLVAVGLVTSALTRHRFLR